MASSADYSIKSIRHFRLEICRGCGFGRTTADQIQRALRAREQAGRPVHLYYYTPATDPRRQVCSGPANQFFPRLRSIERFIRSGRLLDVGTGFIGGYRIAEAISRGWDAYGIDPNPLAVDSASRQAPGRIICGTLDDLNAPKPFDVITLYHVLEHIEEPLTALKNIFSHLCVNGVLDLAVPNYRSLTARLCGEYWPAWTPDDHFNHFTPLSLRLLVERAGFQVIDLHTREGGAEMLNAIGLSWYRRVRSIKSSNRRVVGQTSSIPVEHLEVSPGCSEVGKYKHFSAKISRVLDPFVSSLCAHGFGSVISLAAKRYE